MVHICSVKILVTGGTGFLGSHLAQALLRQGHAVSILGRDFAAASALTAAGACPVVTDLRDRTGVIAACAGHDVVYHVGALSAAWGKTTDFEQINVGGTAAVVDGCLTHAVRRLIYVSSPAVVFDGGDHVCLTESAAYPQRFTSTYARTKKQGEDLVNAATAKELPIVIIRPKAIFGPGDRALLPRLVAAARQGRLRQFGDGRNLVDLTFVENVVHALQLALTAPAAVGRTYFITNDEHIALWPLIRQVLAQLHIHTALRPLALRPALAVAAVMEAQAALTGREPMLTRYSVAILARTQTYDIAAAKHDLGYAPLQPVADGIQRTLLALTPQPKEA